MAEIATIARPYAEALLEAVPPADAPALAGEVGALAQVAGDTALLQFADSPKTLPTQVFELIVAVAKMPSGGAPGEAARNLLRTVIANGRLAVLPEIAAQFHALVDARSGTAQALVESAFPIDAAQLAEVKAVMEKRFGRKLEARLVVHPELIGGVRVVVGDEVLDTSIRARLEQMRAALVA